MACREGARRTFAMHPAFPRETTMTVRQQLFLGNVVTDEIDQRTLHAWDHFLKRFEHERVDEQMIQRCEVRAERHVVEIRVSLGRAEGRIDQFLVVARKRDVPCGELLLKCAELCARQRVTESARATVRQET